MEEVNPKFTEELWEHVEMSVCDGMDDSPPSSFTRRRGAEQGEAGVMPSVRALEQGTETSPALMMLAVTMETRHESLSLN